MTQSERSKIHISCDLWTSSNSLAILGVVAHFVTEDGRLQRCVLALKDIIGKHTGENLAQAMVEVLEEWRFASKLGYFVMWNSWYTMLYVALKLREAIEAYYDHYPDEAAEGDVLTPDEWAILEVIKDFLEVFRDATKGLESHNATLDRVLPSMDILLDEFEEKKEKYSTMATMDMI
jgi:hypothetical protein